MINEVNIIRRGSMKVEEEGALSTKATSQIGSQQRPEAEVHDFHMMNVLL